MYDSNKMLIIEDTAGRPIRGNSWHSDWHSDCLAMFAEKDLAWLVGTGDQLGSGGGVKEGGQREAEEGE